MYVRVAADGQLSLQDCDNLRCFAIREEIPGSAATRLAQVGVAADADHYWLDAAAVLELCGRKQDQTWVSAYWNMLASAADYGYYDKANRRVKAHVENNDQD